jgi:hypothetical protein
MPAVALPRRQQGDVAAGQTDVAGVGSMKPATMRKVVVLPQPDGSQQHQEFAVGDRERDRRCTA